MKKLLLALILTISTISTAHAQVFLGIDTSTVVFLTDTTRLHIGDSLKLRFLIVNTGKDSFTGGSIATKFLISNSKYPAFGYQYKSVSVPKTFTSGMTAIYSIGIDVSDTLFATGVNILKIYTFTPGSTSTPSDTIVLRLNIAPRLEYPVGIDAQSLVLLNDTNNIKLGDSLKIKFNVINRMANEIQFFKVSARVRVVNSKVDTLLPAKFNTVGYIFFRAGDSIKLSFKVPINDSIFHLGNNVVIIWPESNSIKKPDTVRLSFTVLNPSQQPFSIDTGSLSFSTDTSRLFPGDSFDITYKIRNNFGKATPVAFNSVIRVSNDSGTYTFHNRAGINYSNILPFDSSARISFKFYLPDTIFNLGNNVVIIWPESNTTYVPDTIKLQFTVLNPDPNFVSIVPGSLTFSRDTSEIFADDTIQVSYELINRYGKAITSDVTTALRVGNDLSAHLYENSSGVNYSGVLPFNSSVKITFPLILRDTIFELGSNFVTILPAGIKALMNDTISFSLTVLNPSLSPLQVNLSSLSPDTTSLYLNDTLLITYSLNNLYGKPLPLKTSSRVMVSNINHPAFIYQIAFGPGFSGVLPFRQQTNISFSLPLSDSVFQKGNNVVIIWPESNTSFIPDTIRINLSLLYLSINGKNNPGLVRVSFYPNPASDFIYFRSAGSALHPDGYCVTDLSGKVIMQGAVSDPYIDISHLQTGVYLLKVTYHNGTAGVAKVIKD
jgi:hypothetical protein